MERLAIQAPGEAGGGGTLCNALKGDGLSGGESVLDEAVDEAGGCG